MWTPVALRLSSGLYHMAYEAAACVQPFSLLLLLFVPPTTNPQLQLPRRTHLLIGVQTYPAAFPGHPPLMRCSRSLCPLWSNWTLHLVFRAQRESVLFWEASPGFFPLTIMLYIYANDTRCHMSFSPPPTQLSLAH